MNRDAVFSKETFIIGFNEYRIIFFIGILKMYLQHWNNVSLQIY